MARFLAGEYTFEQLRGYLTSPEIENVMESIWDDEALAGFDYPLTEAPQDVLAAVLIAHLPDTDASQDWDESTQDQALSGLWDYIPAWAKYESVEVGWMGGDGGQLMLPDNHTFQEFEQELETNIRNFLLKLEPTL